MSYDIVLVKKEVAEYSETNEIDIGQLLENNDPVVIPFSEDEIKFFNTYFLEGDNYSGKFKLISKDNTATIFEFNDEITAILFSNYISLKSSNSWDVLMLSADLMIETDYNSIRFDFKDGIWR